MKNIEIIKGSKVNFEGEQCTIHRLIDLQYVLVKNMSGKYFKARITELNILVETGRKRKDERDLIDLSDDEWRIAQKRLEIIKPLFEGDKEYSLERVKKLAKDNKISLSTMYRWMEKYRNTKMVSSLAPVKRLGGKGKSRLDPQVEALVEGVISKFYLSKRRKSITRTIEEIQILCEKSKLPLPHANTIRNRIEGIPEIKKVHERYGKKASAEKFNPAIKKFPGADFPLSVAQMDHTKVDIILVDEVNRRPLGRPWITLCMDVYSRMVLGYYISFDPPGAIATGICLSNAILPKEHLLLKHEVIGEWPCWGIMNRIHLDNAKEFRGSMLLNSCKDYGIDIDWRPVATPHYGGHIERLLGTILKKTHDLPGTTYSNIRERKGYNSEKEAAMTLPEFEKWLLNFIVNVYQVRFHKQIGTSPINKFTEGILGNEETPGIGIPKRILDKEKVKLDFLPFFERAVLPYGVLIDNIYYYHEVLRSYINSTEKISGKFRAKRKFIFRRDPRDISVIYFFDPETKEYFPIPYRDFTQPPMSIWEYREAIKTLKKRGISNINERQIFEAHKNLNKIVEESLKKTSKAKRTVLKAISRENIHVEIATGKKVKNVKRESMNSFADPLIFNNIKPFDEYEHGTFE